MRALHQTLDKLVLENKAPRYRTFLGYFLVGFPLLLLAYAIYAQRSYLDCVRRSTIRVDCQYVQEYNFPIASREQLPLTDIKASRVYQEIFVDSDGEKSVQNNVLVLAKDNYIYIENFHNIQAASDFRTNLEIFFRVNFHPSAIISQNNLDTFWKMVRQSNSSQYYLWGLLCLIFGGLLISDTLYSEIYTVNHRTGLLTHKQRFLLFTYETDYPLENIIAARIEPHENLFNCYAPRIILTLSTREEIVLNARLLGSMGTGKEEQVLLEEIEQRLKRNQDGMLA